MAFVDLVVANVVVVGIIALVETTVHACAGAVLGVVVVRSVAAILAVMVAVVVYIVVGWIVVVSGVVVVVARLAVGGIVESCFVLEVRFVVVAVDVVSTVMAFVQLVVVI